MTAGGNVQCWGANDTGQLGDGTTANRPAPANVTGLASGVVALAAGLDHTCAVTAGGGVKCWGWNVHGQLGDGTTIARFTPVDVAGLTSGVIAISAGAFNTCALTSAHGLKCWGLDYATGLPSPLPADVPGLTSGVAAVAEGGLHTCALTTGGGVKCWGDNFWGQLGDGTRTWRSAPVDAEGLLTDVTALATGYDHTCALKTQGGVQCWGANDSGQVGDGTTIARLIAVDVVGLAGGVASIAAGHGHTCALMTSGGVKCWGDNASGQIGNGTTQNSQTPVEVPAPASTAVAVATGHLHTCAITPGRGALCWGANDAGQIGDGTFDTRIVPVAVHSFGPSDFDGDARADVAVYRPFTGTWFSLDSSTANSSYRFNGWGVAALGDVPVIGDFDGDGVLDPTVYRPSAGTWFVLRSSSSYTAWEWFGWGMSTDTPVPGDYDGDGISDAAVYRPSTGEWFIRPSSGGVQWNVTFGGQDGDAPFPADYDGDGRTDIAIYRPATGTWFLLTSSFNYSQMQYMGWGVQAEGDQPAPADYDGDGKTDLAVFRPAVGTWFILTSSSNNTGWMWGGWGTATDQPMPADYDRDGKADLAIYRPSTGEWWVKPSSGAVQWSVTFGQAGDVPLRGMR